MQFSPFEQPAGGVYPSRQAWDATATDLVATMLHRWHLTAREALVGGEAGSVLSVTTADGQPAVLKVGFPHVEGVWEAVGLEHWGPLAPEVIRQDAWTWSMLLEELRPGTRLHEAGLPANEALALGGDLYRRLGEHPAPAGVVSLAEIVTTYLADATTRLPQQHDALAALGASDAMEYALGDIATLAAMGGDALLHGDFNPGNILLSGSEWRTIDPKPMLGDPAFDLFPLIEQVGSPWTQSAPARTLSDALELVAGIVGCDVARAARWCTGRAALNLSWFLDDGNADAARNAAAELRVWREISAP